MRIFGSTIKELAEGRGYLIFAFHQGDKIEEEETYMQLGLRYRQCTQNFNRKI